MGLKDAILQVMDCDVLKCVVNDFELTGADRRSVASMRECVAQSHVATPESVLGYLYETQAKDVCALLGIDSTGRKDARLGPTAASAPHRSWIACPVIPPSTTSR